jgi:chromosome partitioning protein
MGRSVLLVDTSPWQALAFHYGANKVRPGMRSFFASESQDLPVRILACGHDDASLPDIDSYAAKTPFDYVLFDLSGANGKELIAYLQDCDILLVPMLPEPSATRLAEAMMNLLNGLTSFTGQPMFVMNKMDDSSMAKEVQTSLGHLLGDQLLPATIARQSEVQQALAEGIVLPVYAPKAQAVTICNEIARFFEAPKVALTGRAQQRWCER